MKRLLLLTILFALQLGVLPSFADDDVFRVAALMPSAINDLAFSQSMYDGLVAVQEAMGEDAFQFDIQDSTYICR